jgi:hypothetical protein
MQIVKFKNKEKARHNTSIPRSSGLCRGMRGPVYPGTQATERELCDVGSMQLSLSADVKFLKAELLYLTVSNYYYYYYYYFSPISYQVAVFK